jgi:hypothetical protein
MYDYSLETVKIKYQKIELRITYLINQIEENRNYKKFCDYVEKDIVQTEINFMNDELNFLKSIIN